MLVGLAKALVEDFLLLFEAVILGEFKIADQHTRDEVVALAVDFLNIA